MIRLSYSVIILTGLIMALGGCVADAPFKVNEENIPAQLNDGWIIAAPQDVGLSADSVAKVHRELMDESRHYGALGFLIIKDSMLVFESYPRDIKDRDHYHHIQSATKSITSMLFGTLVKSGAVGKLDTLLYDFFPQKFPSDTVKRAITLEHLLTMRSGLRIDNADFAYTVLVDRPPDILGYLLDRPLYASPGDSFYYRDCDPELISYVIGKVAGRSEEALARDALFNPLGIKDYYWEASHDGTTCGAHALHLRPRDMAKIGQMVLQNGKWNGTQVIDSAWLAESTKPKVQTSWENIVWDYGYYWWVLPQYGAFSACGHGGQFIFVAPLQNMVVVMVSMPDTNNEYVGTTLKGFIELVKPLLDNS